MNGCVFLPCFIPGPIRVSDGSHLSYYAWFEVSDSQPIMEQQPTNDWLNDTRCPARVRSGQHLFAKVNFAFQFF